jgi:FMN phosphatase YigB (HAD superfamily)
MNKIELSALPKTWIFDLDGTLVKHNGHLEGSDVFLSGALDFLKNIDKKDTIVIITARPSEYSEETIEGFEKSGIKVDHWMFDMPGGERLLFNDEKPRGLQTAFSYCIKRDSGLSDFQVIISEDK